ncbi:MAG: hypothetical protein IH971_06470 [Candidatus Marinimicrobia bacterium]|nr:hypothetical protein [Candidatus Neomarinimicrobiota bacterium]
MFGYITGILKGNKLANASARICQDVVNFLVESGTELQLPNTAYILRESYCLSSFAMMNPNAGVPHKDALADQAKAILKDWLIKAFRESSTEYHYDDSVEAVISELDARFVDWAEELHESHPELKGKPIEEWLPAAISKFMIHVGSHIFEQHGNEPSNFHTSLYTIATKHLGIG